MQASDGHRTGLCADSQCQFESQCIDATCGHGTNEVTWGGSADIG